MTNVILKYSAPQKLKKYGNFEWSLYSY